MQSVDVAIVGGGMVGLAVACGLQGSGLRVAVLEQREPQPLAADAAPALRVSAINAASEKLLTRLGVWSDIVARRASCYHGMEVWDKDSFGRIEFDDQSMGYSHLGHIVENAVIHYALWQKAQQSSDITLMAPAELQQVAWGENEAFLTLKDGAMLTARLVIGADGANSWLRNKADIPLTFWDYRHHALVATIHTEDAHGAVARQAFHGEGILAFLPLSNPHLCSIVWSLAPQEAERMQQASDEQFNQALNIAFDNRLGLCRVESERQVFPLTGRYARQFAAHRLALVGDAAHTIHPLAGQGVNLGFMDAAELVDELKRLHRQGKDIGQYLYLRRYERSRKHSAALMLVGMQGFRELFAGTHPAKKLLRDMGLKLADTLPGVKPQLLRQAMGLNDLPEWLR
ncbi:FAD-dependent 2-octaprenylphenol hydroxylase [Citrobacter amalonaticus]|uniref:FAD-dependent 2-octaprenylphenol hydroxylase n=1 Tax=Citrobacter amalonaticus TaxID=35703 RepID=UPI001902F07A|nr:FAD-dependent 2-octaprenylphenol hydroxylase [Citrobacter amalonaticus]EKW2925521.1 FAD-dependent 2-octaprenylphenol hydroxylase [Citrobacter amalonaticus]MBJ9275847.1 FAD-dependent 2-octaprenylphenol hydroxylase [Citrobacter amalonaticus]MCR9030839.1 FAD-dependent 2-octaprenylphenol hydroxylase [Citrobacter amalonaticus]MEC5725687.1 FAD-dependent 2-octaprenylphenol hydroxylase [Citrobacter amalonaticus]HAT3924217.1 FAD-dependent 2-octaprenylphenol hydroxylase [Citrobacter amalonaticus]